MFQRLHELSQCLPEREAWERLNEGMPANYDRGLALCFAAGGEWCGVRTYNGNQGVLYRSGPPNGTDFTPCCKFSGPDSVKTLARLSRAVMQLAAAEEIDAQRRDWLAATLATFEREQETILDAVRQARVAAGVDDKEHRAYVYWADEQMQPVHGWPAIRDLLVHQVVERFADKGGSREAGACAVCGREDTAVYGNYAVLACYNLNNPGSIAGGFRANAAHRNFPVCGDCALAIADTFTFAETYLTSSMAGQTYLVLPYSNAPEVREELRERLGRRPQRYSLGKARDLIADELALTDEFAGYGDQLALALVFFKQQNAAWRVQAEVQQLLPSRLQVLHAAGQDIARAPDLISLSRGEDQPVRITAMTFKQFSSASDKPSEETLRDWLTALFAGKPIDQRHFLHALVAKLIATGRSNANLLHWTTRQAWGFYRYASRVRLIVPDPMEEHALMSDTIPESPYGRYVREHADFFRRPELVVAFLTGCYAATVASVQYKERQAAPFAKKFIGRLLTRQHLQRLYREGHGKLAQYGKLGYVITGLDPDLANAWVVCADDWAVSDEEATFAFTIGYSLAYRIGQLERVVDGETEIETLDG
ncbi:CRISPR-associated protein TM1802 [Thiorhodococcus drewsii AZ1]|uniref:CRISPR-associated protein TM1802 n=1 Tax=Thiorhodococcus drewsii AZ1 TaxID=765913 RepID=G2DYJ8_9GAMM|nr:TM1802 family CRISPR-associated protein [Thiorhodococcus drewsii]EGV32625.1 CRISPR-associated protein TM1802 [Thiorhodococcus drewsii AZ1]